LLLVIPANSSRGREYCFPKKIKLSNFYREEGAEEYEKTTGVSRH